MEYPLYNRIFDTAQCTDRRTDQLVIFNRNIQWSFVWQSRDWFKWETQKTEKLEVFCKTFMENNTASIREGFNAYPKRTIRIHDTKFRKEIRGNFYHDILLELFGIMGGWDFQSNAKSNDGYSNISIEVEAQETGIVIELKMWKTRHLTPHYGRL